MKLIRNQSRYDKYAALLLVMLVIVLAFAWTRQGANGSRVIEVNGQGTVTAVPDEYVFRTTYEFKSMDEQTAHGMADKKHQELFAWLQELGVPERSIKANMHKTERPLQDGVSDENNQTTHIL